MRSSSIQGAGAVALAGLIVVQLMSAGAAAEEVAPPTDRLPDLAMGRPLDLRLVKTNGKRRLRFTGVIVNVGAGPFETRAYRKSLKTRTMVVRQRIYDSAGGHRTIVTPAVVKYAGDGHDHWHVQRVAGYELFADTGEGPVLRRGAKVGFCFFDTRLRRSSLPRAPKTRRYLEKGCGTRNSHSIRIGLSVGWADIYPWNFAWQWVDVTGLPAGRYLLKLSADPEGAFVERRETNNCNWTRIQIPRTGSKVTVLERGTGCILPGEVPPPTPTPSPGPTASPDPSPTEAPTVVAVALVPRSTRTESRSTSGATGSSPRALFACAIPVAAAAIGPNGAGPPG